MAFADAVNGRTKLFGAIGYPVMNTCLPAVYNTLAKVTSQNLVFASFPVERPDMVETALRGAYALGIEGLQVIAPYQSVVIPYLDEIDPAAGAIGAVNTLVRTEHGYKGFNTEYSGLRKALEKQGIVFPIFQQAADQGSVKPSRRSDSKEPDLSSRKQISVENVVVIGAGSMARAACYLCAGMGIIQLSILDRTLPRAQELADWVSRSFPRMQVQAFALKDAGRVSYDRFLVIQCSGSGEFPHADDIPTTSATFYRRVQAAFDCIVNPVKTRFLLEVEKRGKPCWNGMDLLVYQSAQAYRYWTGVEADKSQLRAASQAVLGFMEEHSRLSNFVLVGFMGSGKTTVGRALSKKLGWTQVETDTLIVQAAGKSVTQIFKENGEEGFRRLETQALEKLLEDPASFAQQSDTGAGTRSRSMIPNNRTKASDQTGSTKETGLVISTGSGVVLRQENADLLRGLGTVVFLDVTPAVVISRIGRDSTRPILAGNLSGKDRLRIVSAALSRRQGSYQSICDITVNTAGKTPEEIADEIIEYYQRTDD